MAPKKIFLAITPKKELFSFIQNYTHTLWTSTSPKMQISQGASFLNLMQHPGDQCIIQRNLQTADGSTNLYAFETYDEDFKLFKLDLWSLG